ncbi:MAG: glycerol-3-phosphate 1-O-acyltransferase PlsY [Bauldia sp.]|nr:glycerol-3-phosphate 1-O-acyltransferase PlsY [Bauldia sp.]MCW5718388.1 glycerol-3-phosphate 1-O-acyltransferase PlsY [Bauldia sp.]
MPLPVIVPESATAVLLAALFGYLLGSIPFGVLLTRVAGLGDVRKIGSGNIGATNVLRTGRKDLALLTFLFDMLKGTAAVLLANAAWNGTLAGAAGAGAFLGHIFPIWLGFRGGKGVATFLGVTLGLYWPAGLAFMLVWLGMAFAFRFSSLAALTASVVAPIVVAVFSEPLWGLILAALAVMLWFRHAANIRRLLAGEESRIGSRA